MYIVPLNLLEINMSCKSEQELPGLSFAYNTWSLFQPEPFLSSAYAWVLCIRDKLQCGDFVHG